MNFGPSLARCMPNPLSPCPQLGVSPFLDALVLQVEKGFPVLSLGFPVSFFPYGTSGFVGVTFPQRLEASGGVSMHPYGLLLLFGGGFSLVGSGFFDCPQEKSIHSKGEDA